MPTPHAPSSRHPDAPPPSPPDLRPRSLMRMPNMASLSSTAIVEVIQDHNHISLTPGRHDRTPGLLSFLLMSALMVAVPLTILLLSPVTPGGRAPFIAFIAAMPPLAAIIVFGFRFFYARERARGPIMVLDLRRQVLHLHRAGRSIPRAEVIALQITHGLLARLQPSGDRPFVHQLTVVYRSGSETRRCLACWIHNDTESGRGLFTCEQLVAQFSAATGIPAYSDMIRGTKVRHSLITSPNPLTSDEFDIPLSAPPIIDPDHAPIDPSTLVPLPPPPPQCRMCGYSLRGLTNPPRCPECGADFAKHPTART